MLKVMSIFLFQPTFFGLNDKYNESVYEELFYLKHYGGWSFIEAYNLPVGLRRWFVQRLAKQLQKEKEAIDEASSKSGGSSGKSYELNSQTQSMLNQHGSPGMPKI